MQLENLISGAAVLVSVIIPAIAYYSSMAKRVAIMEQQQLSTAQRISQIEDELKDMRKDSEATKEAVNAIKVSMARIETHVEMSKDIMSRLDIYLRNSGK